MKTTAAAGATAALSGSWAFAQDEGRQAPNIVYLLTDQWRAAATHYGGDPNVNTPNLDQLAAESVNFANAVSVCPVCTPYRAALMTGRYPTNTGMFLNDLHLPDNELCMAEIFAGAGYDTAYIGKWHLDGHGRDAYIPPERRQGFQYWKGAECDHNYPHSHYYTDNSPEKRYWEGYDAYAQTRDAQAYLRGRADADKPFFLMMSYGTPHFPHATAPDELKALYPPESLKMRPNLTGDMEEHARIEACGYYGHCTALDRCIGDLLRTLDETGLAQNTLLVFTSDHGEMLGSQGQPPCEKQRPWDESVRVPFLLRFPALQKSRARTIETPINTPDILPTLLALSGIPVPASLEGEDLSALVRGDKSDWDRAALLMAVSPFAGYYGGKEYRGIRTPRYTYVRSLEGPWLFYDNQSDPYQMTNLVGAPETASLQEELDSRLNQALKQIGDDFRPSAWYREQHGYEVDAAGCIPYTGDFKVQSPATAQEQ